MILTRTPFRVSFVGGGSDLPSFYSKYGGAVLSATINKYMYISVHPYFNKSLINLKYSKTELVDNIEKLQHPIVRETLKYLSIDSGIEITSTADVPSGTGLGSSSAFTVGLLHTLYGFKSKLVTKERLANEACMVEIEKVKSPIGKQDQYASAYGGLNCIVFEKDGDVEVNQIVIQKKIRRELEQNLLLFYTGHQRDTNSILKEQNQIIGQDKKINVLKEMAGLAQKMRDVLINEDLISFGELLNINWNLKKSISNSISNSKINDYYKKAIQNGAIGGKLLGAGGGGFLLFYCEPEKQGLLRMALSDLYELKFNFDKEGTKLVYFTDESIEGKGFFNN